jgi:hypothetical protein
MSWEDIDSKFQTHRGLLSITPRINESGRVLLDVEQEVLKSR